MWHVPHFCDFLVKTAFFVSRKRNFDGCRSRPKSHFSTPEKPLFAPQKVTFEKPVCMAFCRAGASVSDDSLSYVNASRGSVDSITSITSEARLSPPGRA